MVVTMSAILVFAIIVILILVVYRKSVLKKIQDAINKKETLSKTPIGDNIEATSKLNLTGDSFDQFNDYKEKYERIIDDELPSVNVALNDANSNAKVFSLLKAKSLLSESIITLNKFEDSMNEIDDGLNKLKDLDDQHTRAIDELDKQIKDLNKNILSKNYSYGPSSDKIEDELSNIKSDYQKFIKTVESGDQYTADDILNSLIKQIETIYSLMKEIPKLYLSLSKDFPKQIDEIDRGHRTMIETDYNFSDDNIDENIEIIKSAIDKSIALLSELKIDDVKQENYKIEKIIDSMYEMMEKEVIAKRKVRKNIKLVYDYIYHARRQNHMLISELEQLSKNYTLEHDEVKKSKLFAKRIHQIESVYNNDYQLIMDKKAVYSEVQSHQQDSKKQLSAIEKEQKDINDSVADLNDEENSARETIQKFDFQLLNIRRKIDNLNLPGLQEDFIEKYKYSYKKVSELGSTINQVKISMDEINKKLSTMDKAMEELISDTEEIVDNAILAERLMQYANRYRNNNEEVNSACVEAKDYFDNNFDYEKSLKIISSAIENVDSGAFNRIKKEYYQNKQNDSKKA
ncbi:septation ring formation regulator EzrA [Apilactobacillus quenuiae]|uniref:septation ring formation regulator EzrA n=1 Tax=Apilactobacillus quenuiae TaxID=2008377 RepID=UPI000D0196A9|nr:septation ring formation regulator EzrA [Apilactobacillus quenuiae]